MPDDYHPLIPPRDPERVDLGRMQADIEFLIQRIERLRRLHDGRQCRDCHRLDRAFLAALSLSNAKNLLEPYGNRLTICNRFHRHAMTGGSLTSRLAPL